MDDVLRRNQFVCIAQNKQSTLKWIYFSVLNRSSYIQHTTSRLMIELALFTQILPLHFWHSAAATLWHMYCAFKIVLCILLQGGVFYMDVYHD